MANSKADKIHDAGVSMWLDALSREMLDTGWLQEKVESWAIRGLTSNPSIFEKAASTGQAYDAALKRAAETGQSTEQACCDMMIADVRRACDLFIPLYERSEGEDGYVSLELDPTKANDSPGSIEQGHQLWEAVGRPNLMLKIAGTEAGLPVISEMLATGYNVNVTLLFSEARYRAVMEHFLQGMERRAAAGQSLEKIASVASFFVSRVDSEVDKRLESIGTSQAQTLRGKAGVANARVAYSAFEEVLLNSERFARLKEKGAQIQRPLWASTSTKNPSLPDTLYFDELIGAHCVNTLTDDTLEAALDHGKTVVTLTEANLAAAREHLAKLGEIGIDMADITGRLLVEEGLVKFSDSYTALLATIAKKLESYVAA